MTLPRIVSSDRPRRCCSRSNGRKHSASSWPKRWRAARLGWHTPRNGPLAGIRLRALHPNHLWVPVGVYETSVGRVVTTLLTELAGGGADLEVWDVGGHRGLFSLLCAHNGASRVLAF